MWFIKAENHKMLVRIANREATDQAAYSEASGLLSLHCLHMTFSRQLMFKILENLLYIQLTLIQQLFFS